MGNLDVARPKDHPVFLNVCLDPTVDLAFGDPVQHRGIRRWRLGTEIAVFGGKIPKVFCNGAHRVEGIVKSLQSAREGAVGYR